MEGKEGKEAKKGKKGRSCQGGLKKGKINTVGKRGVRGGKRVWAAAKSARKRNAPNHLAIF